ncbi:MAG: hypothetical protein ACYC9M_05025 [Desulfobulbaceae bacterium]
MRALRRWCPELCVEDGKGFLSAPSFDPRTRALTVPELLCADLADGDLASFHVLAHINGNLVIRDSPGLTSLDGLRNLETVNGSLALANCGCRELSGLTRLQQVRGLAISEMAKLAAISGCTALSLVEGDLRITGNPLLRRVSGFTSLAGLAAGALTIRDNPALISLCGLTGLTRVRDGLAICNCSELADFRFLSSLETVRDIEVDNTKLADGSPLRRFFALNPHFPGAIRFTRNRELADLSFMAGLTSVGSSLYLNQNDLADLRGLSGLRRVGASLNLAGNRLTDISQLARLEEINGILLLSGNRLTTLHGLENLRRIRTKAWGKTLMTIRLEDNRDDRGRPCLTDIGALANAVEATGRLLIYTDSEGGHRYRVKPGAGSIFATRNQAIEVFGRSRAVRLTRSHVCEAAGPAGTPLLFPDMSRAWQEALQQCPGITPHFLPFRNASEMAACCRAQSVSTLVAIKLPSQRFLAVHGAELRRHGLRFIANDRQTLANCENKRDFKRFMDGHGFGDFVPAYYRSPEEVRYPCIIKPSYGSFGSGQRIVNSPEELGPFPADGVVSEYIPGPVEYATNIFFLDRARYLDITYRKTYHRPQFILGQDPRDQFRDEVVATAHLELFLDILDALNYRGICCFDYKPSATGPKIFEINARIGFTLASRPEDLRKILALYIAHAK